MRGVPDNCHCMKHAHSYPMDETCPYCVLEKYNTSPPVPTAVVRSESSFRCKCGKLITHPAQCLMELCGVEGLRQGEQVGGAPTQRTDEEAFMLDDGCGEAVMADLARQLETELAAAKEEIASEYIRGREHEQKAKLVADSSWKNRAEKAEAALAEANRKLAEFEQDALRYRWLRQHPTFLGWDSDYRADEIDKAVEIARKGE